MNSLLPILNKKELNELLQAFVANLRSLLGDHLNDVILYGSYARDEATEGSDIDLMILVDLSEEDLNKYDDRISDFSTEILLKKVFLYLQLCIIKPLLTKELLSYHFMKTF